MSESVTYEDLSLRLEEHQSKSDWEYQELFSSLNLWKRRFIEELSLSVGDVALCVDHLHRNRYGHYRPGYNGFGLRGEIAINAVYLENRPYWHTLGTLLHELLHGWQHHHGKPGKKNYHNSQFRSEAHVLGLTVDSKGVTRYRDKKDSPFLKLLDRYGVETPDKPEIPVVVSKPKIRTFKLECACGKVVRAEVGLSGIRCEDCGETFLKCDNRS